MENYKVRYKNSKFFNEKTHVGEFLTLLLRKDGEQGVELEKGKKEIEELAGK